MVSDKELMIQAEELLNGSMDIEKATILAMKSVGYTSSKMVEAKDLLNETAENYDNLSKNDILNYKREAMKLMEESNSHLRLMTSLYEKYPVIKITLDNLNSISNHFDSGYINQAFSEMLLAKCKEKGNIKTYFFRNTKTKAIKIGKSINPKERLKQIQGMVGAKLEIIAVIDKDVEHELHNKFKKYQAHSEWFNDKDGLILEYALNV